MGGSDGIEVSYEPFVEGDKSMEASEFLKVFGFRPLQNGLDLFWVHGNSSGRDNITLEGDYVSYELAFP